MSHAHDNSSKCRPSFTCEVLNACEFVMVGCYLCVDSLVGSVMMGEREGVYVGSIGFLVTCKIISFVCSGVGEISRISKSMCSKCSYRFRFRGNTSSKGSFMIERGK